jgi:hypothetical protein
VRKPAKRLPIEEKVRVVLAVLGGEMSASEAARRHGVSVPAVLSWRNRFLDAGRQSLADRVPGGPEQERRVGGGAAAAVGERPAEDGAGGGDGAAADVAEGRRVHRSGPFSDLEALRAAADLPVSRFARLAGIPRRTYHRRLARLDDGEPVKAPWPSPAVDEVEAVAAKYAEA